MESKAVDANTIAREIIKTHGKTHGKLEAHLIAMAILDEAYAFDRQTDYDAIHESLCQEIGEEAAAQYREEIDAAIRKAIDEDWNNAREEAIVSLASKIADNIQEQLWEKIHEYLPDPVKAAMDRKEP